MPSSMQDKLHTEAMEIALGGGCLVGLSGGRDSVALLLLLKATGCHPLAACHLNHGIRGPEADADEEFCRKLCRRLHIPIYCQKADIPALSRQQKQSLETTAREVRRAFMRETALEHRIPAIALAHHADDQAETVLFRLARGSAGVRGMSAVDDWAGIYLLRPMLGITRAEITQWLTENGEPWRDDSTNAVADVARNSIRHEVLPALNKALGRDVTPILGRSARLQQETLEALEAAMAALPLLDPQGRLYLPFVLEQPASLRKAIVRYYLQRHGVPQISESMVVTVADMLPANSPTARLSLPGGYQAIRRQKRLIIQEP